MASPGKGHHYLFMFLIFIYIIILEISQVQACEPTTTKTPKRTTTSEDSTIKMSEQLNFQPEVHVEVCVVYTFSLWQKIIGSKNFFGINPSQVKLDYLNFENILL